MSDNKLFIRVKRRNQTFCFLCDGTDTVLNLKEKVATAANQHSGDDATNQTSSDFLRLLKADSTTAVLEDSMALSACELKEDDAVLHMVLQIADDEWEAVDVMSTDMDDAPAT